MSCAELLADDDLGAMTYAHGGTVAVSSTAEEGTTFRVVLPRQGT